MQARTSRSSRAGWFPTPFPPSPPICPAAPSDFACHNAVAGMEMQKKNLSESAKYARLVKMSCLIYCKSQCMLSAHHIIIHASLLLFAPTIGRQMSVALTAVLQSDDMASAVLLHRLS